MLALRSSFLGRDPDLPQAIPHTHSHHLGGLATHRHTAVSRLPEGVADVSSPKRFQLTLHRLQGEVRRGTLGQRSLRETGEVGHAARPHSRSRQSRVLSHRLTTLLRHSKNWAPQLVARSVYVIAQLSVYILDVDPCLGLVYVGNHIFCLHLHLLGLSLSISQCMHARTHACMYKMGRTFRGSDPFRGSVPCRGPDPCAPRAASGARRLPIAARRRPAARARTGHGCSGGHGPGCGPGCPAPSAPAAAPPTAASGKARQSCCRCGCGPTRNFRAHGSHAVNPASTAAIDRVFRGLSRRCGPRARSRATRGCWPVERSGRPAHPIHAASDAARSGPTTAELAKPLSSSAAPPVPAPPRPSPAHIHTVCAAAPAPRPATYRRQRPRRRRHPRPPRPPTSRAGPRPRASPSPVPSIPRPPRSSPRSGRIILRRWRAPSDSRPHRPGSPGPGRRRRAAARRPHQTSAHAEPARHGMYVDGAGRFWRGYSVMMLETTASEKVCPVDAQNHQMGALRHKIVYV